MSKSKLATDIANGVKEERLTGIVDVRDESDRTGIRLVIELKRGETSQVVLNQLYKHTPLQTSFGIQQIALVEGRPRTLSLRELLISYRDHRRIVIRRRALHLLEKAELKAHILRGLIIARDHIDHVIQIIRGSEDEDTARAGLMDEFSLTRIQSENILRMQLRRLTALERRKLQEDLGVLQTEIEYHRKVLTEEGLVLEIIREDIHDQMDRFSGKRRSEIQEAAEDLNMADLITVEQVVVTLSHRGYIKRTPLSSYRSQGRGGKGITGGKVNEGDFIKSLFVASTHDTILLFSDRGKVYWLKVYELPDAARTSKGRPVVQLVSIEKGERILETIQVAEFDDRMLMFATRKGIVKKTGLSAYSRPKRNGIIAIKIEEEDGLISVALTDGDDEMILSTAGGKTIRFSEKDVREMGRNSRGVRGIALAKDDRVVGMAVVEENGSLLTVCEKGFGKRTLFSEYRPQKRGGKGLIDIRTTERNGPVVTSRPFTGDQDAMLMTSNGMLVRINLQGVRAIGRNTQGIRLINVKPGDRVIGMEMVSNEEDSPPTSEDSPPTSENKG